MITMEIHAGEGGADAAAFAHELAQAVSKYAGADAHFTGGVHTLYRL